MTPKSKNGGQHETHNDHAGVLQTQHLNYSLLGPHRRVRRARSQQITTEKGGQAHKHRYSNLNLIRKNNCSLRATQTLTSNLTASTNAR